MSDYTNHPDWRPLLAAVCASPDDDLPRMVLADWLDEHGESERSEFIRLQCYHRHQTMTCDGDSSVGQPCPVPSENLDNRERYFCPSCQAAREWGVPELLLGEGGWYTFRRGLLETVRCSIINWTGSECGRCGGAGWREVVADVIAGYPRYEREECHHCRGAGRITGIGPELVRSQPVQVVWLTDREPARDYGHRSGTVAWVIDEIEIGPESARLPADLFTVLEEVTGQLGANVVECATREAAHAALSAAAILWAKSHQPSEVPT